jgi:hypothetical protein
MAETNSSTFHQFFVLPSSKYFVIAATTKFGAKSDKTRSQG